ncbi:MAG: hypothetical protein B6A08_15395 [Sorangiineae bacterium NIC37A_2]|jgi:polysaccharide export outer membrane protein|nr:MAG: hypothetical protein B6A08_15395 [Sorangiineae bacterium NIC37A_2]
MLTSAFASQTACGGRQPVTRKELPSPVIETAADRLTDEDVRELLGSDEPEAYRVGPGDSLLVAVYGHAELAIGAYAGAGQLGTVPNGRNVGFVVDNDGTIQFPLIGSVQVAGKTSNDLRLLLEKELAAYVVEPKVTVQLLFPGSIRYYMLGQFTSPGLKYSDRPLRLLEALALGGTIQLEAASLRTAYVARGGRKLPINFIRLLRFGDLSQNIALRTGDVVFVPDNTQEQAFVFGGLPGSNTRGGAVPFVHGQLSLLQALAAAGFGFRERAQGKMSEVRIIRSIGDRAEFIVVDAAMIMKGKAAPFPLEPGDVVYVPMTAITSWNMALEQLIPTLQAVSGSLQPFVQIKYLSE